jgi:hypothetical protein
VRLRKYIATPITIAVIGSVIVIILNLIGVGRCTCGGLDNVDGSSKTWKLTVTVTVNGNRKYMRCSHLQLESYRLSAIVLLTVLQLVDIYS